jgi:predicted RNA binding protein YcfA (HicA-like mRNA interferase family)
VKRNQFVKLLASRGVSFDHQGKRHEIFIHRKTGKKIAVPRHTEFENSFIKLVLKEIPPED